MRGAAFIGSLFPRAAAGLLSQLRDRDLLVIGRLCAFLALHLKGPIAYSLHGGLILEKNNMNQNRCAIVRKRLFYRFALQI